MSKLLRIFTEGGYIEIDLEQATNVQGDIDTSITAKFPLDQPFPIDQMFIDTDGNLVVVTND